MIESFAERFSKEENLNPAERDVLRQTDVRSNEDIDSLVRGFPSISASGVRLAALSNIVAMNMSAAYANISGQVAQQPPQVAFGADPPPFASTPPGTTVGLSPSPPAAPPTLSNLDLRLSTWPVKDQGQRGTCVSFGTTACVEHLLATNTPPHQLYSEQFLYWAIKDHSLDPKKSHDGTWLRYAADMLASDGICEEHLFPYIGALVHPVSGHQPGASAIQDAAKHRIHASSYVRKPSAAASLVLQLLQHGRPVAFSLPVFRDPSMPQGPTNWTTPVGWAYGRVLNPPPNSIVVGGHCVCVTGFASDSSEPNGGYFIIRNSWGSQWASMAPSAGSSNSPEVGYGEISATYVETYCWELLQL